MKQVELEEIRHKAHSYHEAGAKWHFHLLTPTCKLNESDMYAFILECPDKKHQLVYYSDRAEREIGEELAPLLHGAKVLAKELEKDHKPSAKIAAAIKRMKELNDQGIEWHHHVLYPGCMFNEHSPKFTFIFEDPETGDKIESITDEEPSSDLKLIEPLFYRK